MNPNKTNALGQQKHRVPRSLLAADDLRRYSIRDEATAKAYLSGAYAMRCILTFII